MNRINRIRNSKFSNVLLKRPPRTPETVFFFVREKTSSLREKNWISFRENAYLYVKKSSKVPVKNQFSTWNFLQIYIRENMAQYTWKKWKDLSVKTVNPYVKKNEKKIVVFYNKEILLLFWAYNDITSTLRVTPMLLL